MEEVVGGDDGGGLGRGGGGGVGVVRASHSKLREAKEAMDHSLRVGR